MTRHNHRRPKPAHRHKVTLCALMLPLLGGCTTAGTATPAHPSSVPVVGPAQFRPQVTYPTSPSEVAARALRAYIRHPLNSARWWKKLSPYLTPAARERYCDRDPADIQARSTEDAVHQVHLSETSAQYAIATDVGSYTLTLEKNLANHQWYVDFIVGPSSESP